MESIREFENQREKFRLKAQANPNAGQKETDVAKGKIQNAKLGINTIQASKIRKDISGLAEMVDKGSGKVAEQILGRIHEIQELSVPLDDWEREFLKIFDHADFSHGDFDQKTLDGLLHKYGHHN